MDREDERTKDMAGEVVRRIDNSRDREERVIAHLENMNKTTVVTEMLEKVSQRLGDILTNLEEMADKNAQGRAERGERG